MNLTKISEEKFLEKIIKDENYLNDNIIYEDENGNSVDIEKINQKDYYFEIYINSSGKVEKFVLIKDKIKALNFHEKIKKILKRKENFELVEVDEKSIKKILEKIFDLDQNMRKNGNEINKKIDRENLKIVVSIIEKHKKYLLEKASEKEILTIWLVIHHGDLKFMKKYLDFFIKLEKLSKLDKKYLKNIIDRICLYEGKEQVYNTQYIEK